MRNFKTFIGDITTKPPILFPLVILFNLALLCTSIWTCIRQPETSTEINVIWMLSYSVFWIGVADMRKWGALAYIGVTVIDIIVYLTQKSPHLINIYGSPIFLIDILFCFFILFYFKRFR